MTELFLTFQFLHIEGGQHGFFFFFLFIDIQKAKLSILNSNKTNSNKNTTTNMLVAEGLHLLLITISAYILLTFGCLFLF